MHRIAFVIVLLRALGAAAQPAPAPPAEPTWIIGGGVGLGGVAPSTDEDGPDPGGVAFGEIAYRPWRLQGVFVHATYATGARRFNNAWWQARIGGESRACTSSAFCILLDGDVAYVRVTDICQDTATDGGLCSGHAPDAGGVSVTGRFGIDAGWRHVRVRAAFDVTHVFADDRLTVQQYNGTTQLDTFLALEVGLAAAF